VTRPLRAIAAATLTSGRGSVLGPDTWRRAYWWNMTLECGHVVTRGAKYRRDPRAKAGARLRSDVLPAPLRARCDRCAS